MSTPAEIKPSLPLPTRSRWQPLRLGVVNLFYYDSEEFWLKDGHLLLRGNNGTGKSKILSLTLPFLFDAQLRSSRIEPDGDISKKMSWNLLLGRYDRRIGYCWVEFGRIGDDGNAKYLTLGCGMSAVAAKPMVDAWFFLVDGQRVGENLWFMNQQRLALTKDHLKETLTGHGQVFPTHDAYRRAVDERLFQLGSIRYAALIDTLIQLRQPQLSKKPDEAALSNALSEALTPLATELLADVAEAMNQLEEDLHQLNDFETLAAAIKQFNERYTVYARIHSRRQAGLLRSAQTTFDNASHDLNAAKSALAEAHQAETAAESDYQQADMEVHTYWAQVEELLSDPMMKDAKRIDHLTRELDARLVDQSKAQHAQSQAEARFRQEQVTTATRDQKLLSAIDGLKTERKRNLSLAKQAGIDSMVASNLLLAASEQELDASDPAPLVQGNKQLRALAARRHDHLKLIRTRLVDTLNAQRDHDDQLRLLDELRSLEEDAAIRLEAADEKVERGGRSLVAAWEAYIIGLDQLRIGDPSQLLEDLAEWVLKAEQENPARTVLLTAYQQVGLHLAENLAQLMQIQQGMQSEYDTLEDEHLRLSEGSDLALPVSLYRSAAARTDRPGAPFWQLVDFSEHLRPLERAGLEAALEASGILDAWVAPDGELQNRAGEAILYDVEIISGPCVATSLATLLRPADTPSAIDTEVICRLLNGISCSPADDSTSAAWVSLHGQYRVGPLAGNWAKPAAAFIGYAAREAARKRRQQDIQLRLTDLKLGLEENRAQREKNRHDNEQAGIEWKSAPQEIELRNAHAEATAAANALREQRAHVHRVSLSYQDAVQKLQELRLQLHKDAHDLHLPASSEELDLVRQALEHFTESLQVLDSAISNLRTCAFEQRVQLQRQQDAQDAVNESQQQLQERTQQTNDAQGRLSILQNSVGAEVEKLQNTLRQTRIQHQAAEKKREETRKIAVDAAQMHTRCETNADNLDHVFLAAAERRQQAVENLQRFTQTKLIEIAIPNIELPPDEDAWTIEPALTLARRIDQTLKMVKDDDNAWQSIQKLVSQELGDLQRALGALHHQAQAETSDYGLIVSIAYQNRLMRPDQLSQYLVEEIASRRTLLSVREREIIENHLKAEIAAAIQQLMRATLKQVDAINEELDKRPTSTGVRFRLQWQPLAEGSGHAPVGLEAARKRLLNTSSDLWSPEDRSVVGTMLQQRIAIERERADADGGGTMLEQLARALDYRRWHQFVVQRWQDGQWRKLSGPASSGERALGLTVPLFAAVASFYNHSSYPFAPRLVLLDEVFAGIDDEARAHCMALIKEFDLDFVVTSEREWACYAALPGVSICQLQRRAGIDAIHVSRWTWNGRSRKQEADPERRFPGKNHG